MASSKYIRTPKRTSYSPRQEIIGLTVSEAEPICPVAGDILVSTGTIYDRLDLLRDGDRLKRVGFGTGPISMISSHLRIPN